MHSKAIAIIVFLLCIATFNSQAQGGKKTAIVKGKLVNAVTKSPYSDLKVTIQALNVFATSDGDGNFEISEVPYGAQTITISGNNIKSETVNITVDKDIVEVGEVLITPNENAVGIDNAEIPTITLTDNNTSSSDQSDGNSGGGEELLVASRDPFVSAVVYELGPAFFKPRGQRNQNEVEINGVPINNALTNFLSWGSQLGNQTDVFGGRVRELRYGLEPSPYTFGGINGSTYIQATAADIPRGTKISYTASDHNYRNRIMVTSSTGLLKNGWAFTVSANKQWALQGYSPGTFYDGYAYYAGISKVIKKSQFNLTTFGVPLTWSNSVMSTKESYQLANNNYYNSGWGYQTDSSGKSEKRSSNIQKVYQPTTILNYEYRPSNDTRWNTAVGYQFGKDKRSGIDDYNASSPYGNYYRNMPSYYYTYYPPDSATGNSIKQQIMSDPNLLQIDWNRLYNDNKINTQTIYNANGITGNNVTGHQSLYVISDKVTDLKKFTFNTNVEHNVDEHLTLYGGLTFYTQRSESYKQLTDLMGGDFFVNYNQFASQQYIANASPNYNQNNLNNPNAVVRVGDKYGYDYATHLTNALAWGQATYTLNKFDFFLAANAGENSFSREGFMKNGLFPNNSYGTSPAHSFFTYAAKGGLTYKFDSRNFLFINAAYVVTPPTVDNTYISAATRDFTINNPTVQKSQSIEGGYLLRSSKINARVVGYINTAQNVTEIKRFYDDDPAYQTFVNYAMQNENTKAVGTELMLNYRITKQISVTGVAAVGQAIYSNRPNINVFLDNDTLQHSTSAKTYIQNYYLAVGPQSAYTLGINYRPKNYWFANLNFIYTDNNYVEINPNRRTQQAIDLVSPGSEQMHHILDQEKLPAAFTVDLHAGKSFRLARKSYMIHPLAGNNTLLKISLGINNLLNNTNVIVRGREQFRYDFAYKNADKFASTYQYGYGINYYLSVSLNF